MRAMAGGGNLQYSFSKMLCVRKFICNLVKMLSVFLGEE